MITRKDVVREVTDAEVRIRSQIRKTQLLKSTIHGLRQEYPMYLKLENTQHTGSFKARGSLNKILSLSPEERIKGIITASTGNHGMGVARALKLTDVDGKIYLPHHASAGKIEKLKALGSQLQFVDGSPLDAELKAKQVAKESGAIWISPYNDPKIIGGQGTIALEILEEMPDVKQVFITVGGGGMVSGIAAALKHTSPQVRIVGCLPENSPEMYLSVKAGHIVYLDKEIETLSDGSAGGTESDSITFPLCTELIDEWILISEDEIVEAMRAVYLEHAMIIEGSAGVAVAASWKCESRTDQDIAVICGGNIDPQRFAKIIG